MLNGVKIHEPNRHSILYDANAAYKTAWADEDFTLLDALACLSVLIIIIPFLPLILINAGLNAVVLKRGKRVA